MIPNLSLIENRLWFVYDLSRIHCDGSCVGSKMEHFEIHSMRHVIRISDCIHKMYESFSVLPTPNHSRSSLERLGGELTGVSSTSSSTEEIPAGEFLSSHVLKREMVAAEDCITSTSNATSHVADHRHAAVVILQVSCLHI